MADSLAFLCATQYPVVLCGDFNIHMDDADDSVVNRFHQLLDSFDCMQHVAQPTHTAGHILDLVIARSGDKVSDVRVGEMVSDHRLITFKLDVKWMMFDSESVSCRQWKKLSLYAFEADLRMSRLTSPSEQFTDLSADELTEIYNSEMSELLDKHCPSIKRRRKRGLLTPWFDADCRASHHMTKTMTPLLSILIVHGWPEYGKR